MILEITLQYQGGAQFVAEARHHRVVIDQPADDGATDHGMTPPELLLASWGGCVGQHVAQYLQLRGLSAEGLVVRVAAHPAARPLRLKDFAVEVVVPGLNERQLRSLQKAFPASPVQYAITEQNTVRVTAVSTEATED